MTAGLPDFNAIPAGTEPVTVFATQTNHYFANGDAKPRPFMPVPKYGNKTSSTRIFGMMHNEIWQWAEDHVKSAAIQNMRGRFDFTARVVYDNNLTFNPDNEPERHANIDGWSDIKQNNKDKALRIAEETTFCCEVKVGGLVGTACQNRDSGELSGSFEHGGKTATFSANTVKDLAQAMLDAVNSQSV